MAPGLCEQLDRREYARSLLFLCLLFVFALQSIRQNEREVLTANIAVTDAVSDNEGVFGVSSANPTTLSGRAAGNNSVVPPPYSEERSLNAQSNHQSKHVHKTHADVVPVRAPMPLDPEKEKSTIKTSVKDGQKPSNASDHIIFCCASACARASGSQALYKNRALALPQNKCYQASHITKRWEGQHGLCPPLEPPPVTYEVAALESARRAAAPPPRIPEGVDDEFAAADEAQTWIEENYNSVLNTSVDDGIVVDYTWRASRDFALVGKLPLKWTFLTAVLKDPPGIHLPLSDLPVPSNQVIWAPANAHRIKALAATLNLFTMQLLLRSGALVSATGLPFGMLVSLLIPMSQTTVLLLPCGAAGEGEQGVNALLEGAFKETLKTRLAVGLHAVRWNARILGLFGKCRQPLVAVQLLQAKRGVRHGWCHHQAPFTHKFNLLYKVGQLPVLEYNVDVASVKGALRQMPFWMPNVNFAELMGWGVTTQKKMSLLFDAFNIPSFSDAGLTNWVLAKGGRAVRIDWDNPNKRIINGSWYVERTQAQVACIHGDFLKQVRLPCPCCVACIEHPWSNSPVPFSCHQCFACTRGLFAKFLSPRWVIEHELHSERTWPCGFEPKQEGYAGRCYAYAR